MRRRPANQQRRAERQRRRHQQTAPLDHAVRIIRFVCCVAGSPSLLDDVRDLSGIASLRIAIQDRDTPALYDRLVRAISFQGVSDRAASTYLEHHGSVTWAEIAYQPSRDPSCPKLQSYWHYSGCGYSKSKRTCAHPEHFVRCPVPKHRLRSGRLNQAAYSLFLFVRDMADGDLVSWIDAKLEMQQQISPGHKLEAVREALIGPLRNVFATGDKIWSMALADVLLAAPASKPDWRELGGSMVAVDSLVHNFLHRTGVLKRIGGEHAFGSRCYGLNGCAEILERVSRGIDAREFNREYPNFFPRFVQHAIWRFCAQDGLAQCNSIRIRDGARCQDIYCRVFPACDRVPVRPTPT